MEELICNKRYYVNNMCVTVRLICPLLNVFDYLDALNSFASDELSPRKPSLRLLLQPLEFCWLGLMRLGGKTPKTRGFQNYKDPHYKIAEANKILVKSICTRSSSMKLDKWVNSGCRRRCCSYSRSRLACR